MKKFEITYNHSVYKPSNIAILNKQKEFKVVIEASSIDLAKNKLKDNYNLNPFYFNFKEI